MPTRHVVLMTQEAATVSAVASALSSNGTLAAEDVCRDLATLASHLEKATPPAVLVDIDPNPAQQLAKLEALVHRFGGTRFVVLANEMDPAMVLEAMQIGARHFMTKRTIVADLTAALKRLCPPAAAGRRGEVITVLSAGGGCGATTIAVNLANELQLTSQEPALAVDLDWAYGTIPTYLGVAGQYGILDLLNREGNIDSELISTTVLEADPRLHILAVSGTSGLASGRLNTGAKMAEALDACRSSYRYSVLDAPRLAPDQLVELAKLSDRLLMVLQLTLKDIRVAKLMLAALHEIGVPAEAITPVVNRYRKRTLMIELEDAQKALKRDRLVTLANDFPAARQAIDLGQPLAKAAARSPLRRGLQELAQSLVDQPAPQATAGR